MEQARERARQLLGALTNGGDPALEIGLRRNTLLINEAAVRFLNEHVSLKRKPKTLASYKHALDHHIIPRIGNRSLIELERWHISKLHASLSSSPYMANYVVMVLSSLFSWAEREGLVSENHNPARRIEKFRENRRERFLSTEEFARLGATLREAETIGLPYEVDETRATAKHAPKVENRRVVITPDAIAATRLLILTGCRLREVLGLRWREVDFERGLLLLPDSKTGRKTVMLGPAGLRVLQGVPKIDDFVFPSATGKGPRGDLKRPWAAITRRAGLRGLRIHDLRHSFAAVAAGAGFGLPIIGKLLGHSQPATTHRYAHLADGPVRHASAAIEAQIAEALHAMGPRSKIITADLD